MQNKLDLITPQWPAPANIRAAITTRAGGVSLPPYDSLNLGDHVGDVAKAVAENRAHLTTALALPTPPCWITQTHSTIAVDTTDWQIAMEADASYSTTVGHVCIVMTADCLPILLCNQAGDYVAAIHAGWRGLADGIIEATIAKAPCPAAQLMAYLGPAIGPAAFDAGDDVYAAFTDQNPADASGFKPQADGKWKVDMYHIARQRLAAIGMTAVYGEASCTVSQPERFFSYRREGDTGRIASLIWIESAP